MGKLKGGLAAWKKAHPQKAAANSAKIKARAAAKKSSSKKGKK